MAGQPKLERKKLHYSASLKFKVPGQDYTMFETSSSSSEEWDVSGLTVAQAETLEGARYEHLRETVNERIAAEAEDTINRARGKS